MLMEMCTKGSGRMTKLMGRESTPMLTVRDMKETGLKTNNMAMDWRNGQMEHLIKGFTSLARSTDMASSRGLTEALLLVNSMTIIFTGGESMNGLMKECLMVNGRITKWKDMGHSHGLTEEDMWANISMI
jgi:hypothetical protein